MTGDWRERTIQIGYDNARHGNLVGQPCTLLNGNPRWCSWLIPYCEARPFVGCFFLLGYFLMSWLYIMRGFQFTAFLICQLISNLMFTSHRTCNCVNILLPIGQKSARLAVTFLFFVASCLMWKHPSVLCLLPLYIFFNCSEKIKLNIRAQSHTHTQSKRLL